MDIGNGEFCGMEENLAKSATVSLWLGHASALTVHRTVIHYLVAATLPFLINKGGMDKSIPYGMSVATYSCNSDFVGNDLCVVPQND